MRRKMDNLQQENVQLDASIHELRQGIQEVKERLSTAKGEIVEKTTQVEELNTCHNRSEYEWCAEREEHLRERENLKTTVQELNETINKAQKREMELERTCD